MKDYQDSAVNFRKKTGTTIEVCFFGVVDRFFGENRASGKRNQFIVTIRRNDQVYSFTFTDSIANYEKSNSSCRIKPGVYDILVCLTTYDFDDFDDFVSEFGYSFNTEREYIKLKSLYFSMKDEYTNVMRLFHDVIEELREII